MDHKKIGGIPLIYQKPGMRNGQTPNASFLIVQSILA